MLRVSSLLLLLLGLLAVYDTDHAGVSAQSTALDVEIDLQPCLLAKAEIVSPKRLPYSLVSSSL